MDKLFFKVWKNIYINKIIISHLKLYNDNKEIKFQTVKDFKEYKYREYIEKIIFNSKKEKITNDLFPKYGVLKYIVIANEEFDIINDDDENYIPDGVEYVEFKSMDKKYPIKLTNLPNSVTSLIGYQYENILDIIPSNITTFSISHLSRFDQTIKLSSFESITNLNLGFWFNNGELVLKKGCLRNTLKVLNISGYRQIIDNGVLPDSIINLSISLSLSNKSLDLNMFPKYLETLSIEFYNDIGNSDQVIGYGTLPNTLKNLKLVSNNLSIDIKPNSLPVGLKVLELIGDLNVSIITNEIIGHLENLESFKLLSNGVIINHDALPKFGKLSKLVYGFYKKKSIDLKNGFFPESITNLTLYLDFKSPLPIGYFPNNLKSLTLGGRSYNHQFEIGLLPSTLTQLIIGDRFLQPIKENQLPNSLVKLTLGITWNHQWNLKVFPLSLQYLELSHGYSFKNDIINSCPSFKIKYITNNEKSNYELIN